MLKEIKAHTDKKKDIPCSWTRRLDRIKMTIGRRRENPAFKGQNSSPKLQTDNTNHSEDSIQTIPGPFFPPLLEIETHLKICIDPKEPQVAKTNLKSEKVAEFKLLDFKSPWSCRGVWGVITYEVQFRLAPVGWFWE